MATRKFKKQKCEYCGLLFGNLFMHKRACKLRIETIPSVALMRSEKVIDVSIQEEQKEDFVAILEQMIKTAEEKIIKLQNIVAALKGY